MRKLAYISVLLFLFSCTPKETWVDDSSGEHQGSISFKGKSIETKLYMPNETGEAFMEEVTYTIVEKIDNDKNTALSIYLLKNETDNTFTSLPELRVDENTRKFDMGTLLGGKYKEAELRAWLFDSVFTVKGITAKGMYPFSAAAYGGREFKREK